MVGIQVLPASIWGTLILSYFNLHGALEDYYLQFVDMVET